VVGEGRPLTHCMHWVPGVISREDQAKECRKFDMHLCSKSEVERHFHFGTPVCSEAIVSNPSDAGQCSALQGSILHHCDSPLPEASKGSMSVTDAECTKPATPYCCAVV
jgi:hypothetical protein